MEPLPSSVKEGPKDLVAARRQGSSFDSSRASLQIREESSACPETMEGPSEGQKPPRPK